MQEHRHLLFRVGLYWAGVVVVLFLVYPVGDDYRFGILTRSETVLVYLEMSSLIVVAGSLVSLLVIAWSKAGSLVLTALASLLQAALLCAYGIVIPGLSPALKEDLPLGAMHAHFFRDFMGVKFSFAVAPLCGLLLGFCIGVRERTQPK